ERVVREDQLDVVEVEELLVLLDHGVLRLDEDAHQLLGRQVIQRHGDGQATDEFRDQPVLHQVVVRHLRQRVLDLLDGLLALLAEAHQVSLADTLLDDLLETFEGAAADEQDVPGVDLDVFLVRVLAAGLRRDVGDSALDDLEEGLLHAFAGDVAGDARVVRLAGDLVDLVDVDDAALGAGHIAGVLDQPKEDVLDVLTDIARLGQRRRVRDRERNVEDAGERLGEVRLAGAGRADEQDVALLEFDVVVHLGVDALVVIVDGDGEDLLRAVLADDVVVQVLIESLRRRDIRGHRLRLVRGGGRLLFLDDLPAELDAFVADVHLVWAGDQAANFFLAFVTERAAIMHDSPHCARHP